MNKGGNDDRKRASGGKGKKEKGKNQNGEKVNSSLLEGSGCVKKKKISRVSITWH